jgi:RimJ/RimL family protein N-acetyltransferase
MSKYIALKNQVVVLGKYSIVPIRHEDRHLIMEWRNQQMHHLRQEKPLTKEMQDEYFTNVISKIFKQEQPEQILFSYIKDFECIGYGGLVHINWRDKNAELSFIMKTELEEIEFELHWKNFLKMINDIARNDLRLIKTYTYAYDLRPKLFNALEDSCYKLEARLRKHKNIDNNFIDVLIHSRVNE